VVLAILVYWLIGFAVDDIATIPGPSYDKFEAERLDPVFFSNKRKQESDLAKANRQLEEKKSEQMILRDSTQSTEKTISHLLDLQKASFQENGVLSDAEQKAFNASMNMFLDNQKQDQALSQEIARLAAQLNALQDSKLEADGTLDRAREPIRVAFAKIERRHNMFLAFLQLSFLILLLAAAAWVIIKKKAGVYSSIMLASGVALIARITEVVHNWFPSRLFRYVLLAVAIAVVVRLLIYFLRTVSRPTARWLLKQYRESYERFFCPVCDYPIRRGPMRYLFWTRRSAGRLALTAGEGSNQDPRYICPACGTSLYEECSFCHFMRHALLPYCEHCGEKKEITPTDRPA